MFVLELTYKKSLAEVDRFREEHWQVIDKAAESGQLIVSGRKNTQDGGVVILNMASLSEVNKFIESDPFHREDVATYRVIEFKATKAHKSIQSIL